VPPFKSIGMRQRDFGKRQEFVGRPCDGVSPPGGIFDSGTGLRRDSSTLQDDDVSAHTPPTRMHIRKELFGHISFLALDFRLGA
jgi:hypothetical protein